MFHLYLLLLCLLLPQSRLQSFLVLLVRKLVLILKDLIWEDSKSGRILVTGKQDNGLYFVNKNGYPPLCF
uniref:Uncharacterized protein n=1 Tax=Helianthus annuus TaxID=4232 RepID=A0A251SMU3_HELAN